jgi:hypothetical protein
MLPLGLIHSKLILLVALYGRESLSLVYKGKHKLVEFQNRVLRRIFGLTRDEVTESLIKINSEELHNLKSSPGINSKIRTDRIRWTGHVARMENTTK